MRAREMLKHPASYANAWTRVIAEPIDAVILATPPGFRPSQIRASVDRGLHVYAERPLAVDAAGVEDVERSGRRAADRGLSFDAVTGGECTEQLLSGPCRKGPRRRGRPRP